MDKVTGAYESADDGVGMVLGAAGHGRLGGVVHLGDSHLGDLAIAESTWVGKNTALIKNVVCLFNAIYTKK